MAVNNTGRLALNNTAYDTLKYTATIALPALSAFYAGLALLWGLPYSTQVVGTLALIAVLIGALLGISTASYNNGKLDNPDNPKVQVVEKTVTLVPAAVELPEPAPVDGKVFPDLKD